VNRRYGIWIEYLYRSVVLTLSDALIARMLLAKRGKNKEEFHDVIILMIR